VFGFRIRARPSPLGTSAMASKELSRGEDDVSFSEQIVYTFCALQGFLTMLQLIFRTRLPRKLSRIAIKKSVPLVMLPTLTSFRKAVATMTRNSNLQ